MPNAAPKKEHNVHLMSETHRDNTYKEELATNDKEIAAAALAIYDREYATLASHDRELAVAVFITTYDKEPAAALDTCREDTTDVEEGSRGGIAK
jgi:hypothetical protein